MKKLVFLCIAACCLFGCQNAEKKAKQHGEAQIVQENGEKLTVEVELVESFAMSILTKQLRVKSKRRKN